METDSKPFKIDPKTIVSIGTETANELLTKHNAKQYSFDSITPNLNYIYKGWDWEELCEALGIEKPSNDEICNYFVTDTVQNLGEYYLVQQTNKVLTEIENNLHSGIPETRFKAEELLKVCNRFLKSFKKIKFGCPAKHLAKALREMDKLSRLSMLGRLLPYLWT